MTTQDQIINSVKSEIKGLVFHPDVDTLCNNCQYYKCTRPATETSPEEWACTNKFVQPEDVYANPIHLDFPNRDGLTLYCCIFIHEKE